MSKGKKRNRKLSAQRKIKPRLLNLTSRLTIEILLAIIGVIVAIIALKPTDTLEWEKRMADLRGIDLYIDEENKFYFHNYDEWWSQGTLSPPNLLFQEAAPTNEVPELSIFMMNEIHEYWISPTSNTRSVPDADLEYFVLHLPDSRTRLWWTPGASVYLLLQVVPNMVANQHGMETALYSYFEEKDTYEYLSSNCGNISLSSIDNHNLQNASLFELKRIRNKQDILLDETPRFKVAAVDDDVLKGISDEFVPTKPLPEVSDGNNRNGEELRLCMVMFYRDRTLFNLTLYAESSVYDKALTKILRPALESWSFID